MAKLQGEEVLLVQKTAWVKDYNPESKMAGRKYRIYSYNGKAFAVDTTENDFEKAFDSGNLHTINLEANEEGQLNMVGYITFDRMRGLKENQAKLDAISVENYKPQRLTNPEDAIA